MCLDGCSSVRCFCQRNSPSYSPTVQTAATAAAHTLLAAAARTRPDAATAAHAVAPAAPAGTAAAATAAAAHAALDAGRPAVTAASRRAVTIHRAGTATAVMPRQGTTVAVVVAALQTMLAADGPGHLSNATSKQQCAAVCSLLSVHCTHMLLYC